MNTWYCPNGKAFMREICLALRESVIHCLVELPVPLVREFTNEFTQYCRKYLSHILVRQIIGGTSRNTVLRDLFNIPDNEPMPPVNDLLRLDAADRYILLEFAPSLSSEERQEWMEFLEELDRSTKRALDRGTQELLWKVIAVLPGSSAPYRPDMGMRKFMWWGLLHSSDMEYATEQFFAPVLEPEDRASYYWLYSLCRGLASSDPMLAKMDRGRNSSESRRREPAHEQASAVSHGQPVQSRHCPHGWKTVALHLQNNASRKRR